MKIDISLLQRLEKTIDTLNPEKGKIKVLVSVFGRSTPVELNFMQVESL